jgi:hypothetical protein
MYSRSFVRYHYTNLLGSKKIFKAVVRKDIGISLCIIRN